jgi:arylsulfatase A-like enzyme
MKAVPRPIAVALLVALNGLIVAEVSAAKQSKPNFVFFLVDDLGWGAMSAYGNTYHETPEFDRLCDQGMRFTNAYAACTVCSPSRAAILTGQYPARLRLTDWIAGHPHPKAKLRIPDWSRQLDHGHTTLPEALRQNGYQTWFLGKWHLMPIYDHWTAVKAKAEQAKHTPEAHGFDVNIGGCAWGQPKGRGRYFYPFDLPGLDGGTDGEYLTDRLTEEALQLLDNAGEQPFLLYMSYYTVHGPIMAKADDQAYFLSKLGKKVANEQRVTKAAYAAMHKSLDESVGRVMEKIEALGKKDNTIVIFTGDNGGDRHDACGGLRGRKGLSFEGGVRESTCVVWPGVVEGGSVSNEPIIGTDFYPTMLEMAGLQPDSKQHRDGLSLVPLLTQSGELDRDDLYWHYPHYHRTTPYSAVRHRDWKLIEFLEDGQLMLFDLAKDPSEERNLADLQPERAQELLANLNSWREQVAAQMPTPNPNYEPDR